MNRILQILSLSILIFLYSCDPDQNSNINQGPDTITIDSLKIHRKVLIIGIDGFRSDVMQESMTPFMFALQNKNSYYNVIHESPRGFYNFYLIHNC